MNDRWKRCPSTHCERHQECRSPHECSAAGKFEKPKLFLHMTPKPDGCEHDFKGWEPLKDEEGRECGGTTVCTKCGMDAMSYTLRVGP